MLGVADEGGGEQPQDDGEDACLDELDGETAEAEDEERLAEGERNALADGGEDQARIVGDSHAASIRRVAGDVVMHMAQIAARAGRRIDNMGRGVVLAGHERSSFTIAAVLVRTGDGTGRWLEDAAG